MNDEELQQAIPKNGLLLSSRPELIRPVALKLLSGYVPSDTGEERFSEIAVDYAGGGTTCGFLCHWLFWRLGCRHVPLVNRTDASFGLRYSIGKNISKIRYGGVFTTADAAKKKGIEGPKPGDVLFVSNGPPGTEHVMVLKSIQETPQVWTTFDAGQRNEKNQQCARICSRAFKDGKLTFRDGPRTLVGWVSLEDLPLTAVATLWNVGNADSSKS